MFNNQCCRSGSWIRCLLDPWIQEPGWVMNIPDHISESFETSFGLKIPGVRYLNSLMRIRDGKIRIRDPG
jgi:hypothetical protein